MTQFLIGFILAWFLCSLYTHAMIAAECEKLGGFFVGKRVFKCVVIEEKESN